MNETNQELRQQAIKVLSEFIDTHDEIYDMVSKLYHVETVLSLDEIRYQYLVSLISSDNIIDVKSAEKSLDELNYIKDNLKYLCLNDSIKDEVLEFVNKGVKIIKRDLKEFNNHENNR